MDSKIKIYYENEKKQFEAELRTHSLKFGNNET